MLQSVGSQRVGCDLETEQQQSLIRPLPLKVNFRGNIEGFTVLKSPVTMQTFQEHFISLFFFFFLILILDSG